MGGDCVTSRTFEILSPSLIKTASGGEFVSVVNLKLFSLCLWEALVIRDFFHELTNSLAESLLQFFRRGIRIFHRVVELRPPELQDL